MAGPKNIAEIHIAKLETSYEYLQAELERVNSNLEKMNKVLFHGNGTPPLPQQICDIRGDIERIDQGVHEKFTGLDTRMNLRFKNLGDNIESKIALLSEQLHTQMDSRKLQVQSNTKIKVALVTAVGAIITALVAIFM